MRFHRKTFCLALVFVMAGWLPSFGQALPEFGVAPLSGPNGMMLLIGGPLLHPSAASTNGGWIGYHIYRKAAGDTGFVRITTVPLSRPGSLVDLEKAMGGSIDGFERFAGLSSKQELWKSIENNDSVIVPISFLSKNFRKALGQLIIDSKVVRGTTYEYRATLVAADGTESKPSEPQKATFGVPLLPLVGPLHVNGKSTDKGVVISWTINPDDSGAFSYSVYRCPDSVGTFLKLNLAALTLAGDSAQAGEGTFTDTTARPGRTYYYAVVSTDYAGNESPRMHLVSLQPLDYTTPAIPQNVFANPSELGIAITWDTVRGANVIGYNIYRSTEEDSNYVLLNAKPLPVDLGYYEDRGTTLSDRYFYRVTTVDKSGHESERSARALSLFGNRLAPVPPQGVRAEPASKGIVVRWQKSDETDVRGYYVFRADGFNGELSQISPLVAADTTEYVDTSRYLSSRSQYWYLVQAINYTGLTSTYSVPAAASPDKAEMVDAPRSFFGYPDGDKVRLFWTRPDNNAISGFSLYRAKEADSLKWEPITTSPLSREIGDFTDSTGASGSTYVYQLRAVDSKGIESAPSHNIRVTVFEPVPLPPGGIRVIKDGPALKVIWTKTYQRSVSEYRIYRRSDREPVQLLAKQPAPTAATEYRDSTARQGVRYYYSISCVDQSGREGDPSVEVTYFSE